MAGSRFREGWREESSVISMAVSTVRVIIGNNVPGWREIARKNTRDTGLEARWLRPRPSADLEQGNRNLTGAPRQGEPESRDRLFVPTLSLPLSLFVALTGQFPFDRVYWIFEVEGDWGRQIEKFLSRSKDSRKEEVIFGERIVEGKLSFKTSSKDRRKQAVIL